MGSNIIILRTPKSAKSKRTQAAILSALKDGYKSSEILARMDFVASPQVIKTTVDDFKVTVNQVTHTYRSQNKS